MNKQAAPITDPSLLLGKIDNIDSLSLDEIYELIVDNDYTLVEEKIPACRFRGTMVKPPETEGGKTTIIGWQRNIGRLRKMDVTLPTVITITIDSNSVIESIDLHKSFKGSKGLLCHHNYLHNNIQKLVGLKIDSKEFLNEIKVINVHCFHIFEVLGGVYSFVYLLKNNLIERFPGKWQYEEEVADLYRVGDMLIVGIKQFIGNNFSITGSVAFHDLMKKISYSPTGALQIKEGIKADFTINDKVVMSEVVSHNSDSFEYLDVRRFLIKCMDKLKAEITDAKGFRIYNTNLFPVALIGLTTQSVALRAFKNNYSYILYALTAIQRNDVMPLCIGSVLNQEEADKYFPGFIYSELIKN